MEVISTGRQAGKTVKAIKFAAENDSYIVVANKQEASMVNETARKLELHIRFPLTWEEFLDRRYQGQNIKSFVIDNADRLLQHLSPTVPVEMITVTAEVPEGARGWLSKQAEEILVQLYSDSEYCLSYRGLNGTREENEPAIKELNKHNMIECHRGLMTEDGEVAGSGWCRSVEGNAYVEEFEL